MGEARRQRLPAPLSSQNGGDKVSRDHNTDGGYRGR
jgi:hypothetical protein